MLKKLNMNTKLVKAKLNKDLYELREYKKCQIYDKKELISLKFKYLKNKKQKIYVQKM